MSFLSQQLSRHFLGFQSSHVHLEGDFHLERKKNELEHCEICLAETFFGYLKDEEDYHLLSHQATSLQMTL